MVVSGANVFLVHFPLVFLCAFLNQVAKLSMVPADIAGCYGRRNRSAAVVIMCTKTFLFSGLMVVQKTFHDVRELLLYICRIGALSFREHYCSHMMLLRSLKHAIILKLKYF